MSRKYGMIWIVLLLGGLLSVSLLSPMMPEQWTRWLVAGWAALSAGALLVTLICHRATAAQRPQSPEAGRNCKMCKGLFWTMDAAAEHCPDCAAAIEQVENRMASTPKRLCGCGRLFIRKAKEQLCPKCAHESRIRQGIEIYAREADAARAAAVVEIGMDLATETPEKGNAKCQTM